MVAQDDKPLPGQDKAVETVKEASGINTNVNNNARLKIRRELFEIGTNKKKSDDDVYFMDKYVPYTEVLSRLEKAVTDGVIRNNAAQFSLELNIPFSAGDKIQASIENLDTSKKSLKEKQPDFPEVTGNYYVDYHINSFNNGDYRELNTENYDDYVKAAKIFLEENISDKKVPGKNEGFKPTRAFKDIAPQLKAKKIKKIENNFSSISKSMLHFMGKGDVRYYLNGMVIDDVNNKLMASNGHALVIIKAMPSDIPTGNPHYTKGLNSSLGNIYNRDAVEGKKDAEEWIDGKFPEFSKVEQSLSNIESLEISTDVLSGYAAGIAKASKFLQGHFKQTPPITIKNKDSVSVFDANNIEAAANLVRGFGYKNANIALDPQSLSIESTDGKVKVIVMKMRDDSGDLFKPFDLNRAEYSGDKYDPRGDKTDKDNVKFSKTTPQDINILKEYAKDDEIFRYPISDKTTIQEIMSEVDPSITFVGKQVFGSMTRYTFNNELDQSFFVIEQEGNVWIDVSDLTEGSRGSAIYAATGNYAANTGKIYIGDPEGLTNAEVIARNKAMLSLALKYGRVDFLGSSKEQAKGI